MYHFNAQPVGRPAPWSFLLKKGPPGRGGSKRRCVQTTLSPRATSGLAFWAPHTASPTCWTFVTGSEVTSTAERNPTRLARLSTVTVLPPVPLARVVQQRHTSAQHSSAQRNLGCHLDKFLCSPTSFKHLHLLAFTCSQNHHHSSPRNLRSCPCPYYRFPISDLSSLPLPFPPFYQAFRPLPTWTYALPVRPSSYASSPPLVLVGWA